MQFRASILAALAFATTAFAQTADFDSITVPAEVVAGSKQTVTWPVPANYNKKTDTVKISLIGGKTQDTQIPIADIASGVANTAGSYEWTVDASLGDQAVYGLIFKLERDTGIFQYSNPFQIKAGASGASGSNSATTTVTTSQGVKTITLSSCTTSSTTSTTTTTSTSTTPTVTPTQTPSCTKTPSSSVTPTKAKTTVVVVPTQTLATSVAVVPTQPPSQTTGVAVVPTANAAAQLGAPLAAIGGIALALFM